MLIQTYLSINKANRLSTPLKREELRVLLAKILQQDLGLK
jgi:hypothetical protein